jgi:PIN domain nuclease of toxin-antitoxin system
MRLLLDTHAFLWFVIGDSALSNKSRALIEDESNDKFFSVASLWEVAIKVSIGRLTLSAPFDHLFPAQLVKQRNQISWAILWRARPH